MEDGGREREQQLASLRSMHAPISWNEMLCNNPRTSKMRVQEKHSYDLSPSLFATNIFFPHHIQIDTFFSK